jgi:hypothetical protein
MRSAGHFDKNYRKGGGSIMKSRGGGGSTGYLSCYDAVKATHYLGGANKFLSVIVMFIVSRG